MRTAKITTATLWGIEGLVVAAEVDVAAGLPAFHVVGLGDKTLTEARDRVKAAIKNSGFRFPDTRVTVNLAPADLKKSGSAFDLGIAVGLLTATGQSPGVGEALVLGELGLLGNVRPVAGVLPMLIAARERGIRTCYLPAGNFAEAEAVRGLVLYPVSDLLGLIAHLRQEKPIQPVQAAGISASARKPSDGLDLAHIRGQLAAKRAAMVAAAGGHNLLLSGPPGGGKTLLARALPSLLPPLSDDEAIELSSIYSAAGLSKHLQTIPPFRSPHTSVSWIGLVGGGTPPRPGEITLSHRGILFLDEMPEFSRQALEALRQPLEDGFVTVVRAGRSAVFPSRFMLVGARNPCPCGFFGDESRPCVCSPQQISGYEKKLSGPLLDRFDLTVTLPRLSFGELRHREDSNSAAARSRVGEARERQAHRFGGLPFGLNAMMRLSELERFCRLDTAGEQLLSEASASLALTARTCHRILKLSRTIADLEGDDLITTTHIAEALQYRLEPALAV